MSDLSAWGWWQEGSGPDGGTGALGPLHRAPHLGNSWVLVAGQRVAGSGIQKGPQRGCWEIRPPCAGKGAKHVTMTMWGKAAGAPGRLLLPGEEGRGAGGRGVGTGLVHYRDVLSGVGKDF